MMMKRYLIKTIHAATFLLALLTYSGCKSFVEVEAPKSQLLGNLVFEEVGTVEAALAGVYTQLREGYGSMFSGETMSMTLYLAQYTDELVNYNNSQQQSHGPNFYKHLVYADSEDLYSLWTAAYNQVYNVNVIIEGIQASSTLPEVRKGPLIGEALFIRALVHFHLVNLFGDVPYVTQTDYLQNQNLSRMPVEEVYQKVIADLLEAESLTSESYPSDERVRINKSVVRALLSRVFLYHHEWDKAGEMATSVIDNPAYVWVDDLSKVFLKESTGTIWAFKPGLEGSNTEIAYSLLVLSNPIPYSRSMAEGLYHAFETGDLRKTTWVNAYTEGDNTWYYPYKYKIRGNIGEGISREYPIMFRLEEQYLIRAEARAQQDNISGAQEDLNKIRHRAGLNDTGASSKAAMLDAILHERQVELFTEYGHRWFDMKRMGKAAEILAPIKQHWKPTHMLFPIPDKELLVNKNLLPQNPGYEL